MLDKAQLDNLINNLETGAATLDQATQTNTQAQTAAATAKAALDAATKANQDNVKALKDFVAALDSDGNDPAAQPAPGVDMTGVSPASILPGAVTVTPNGTGTTTAVPSDSGASGSVSAPGTTGTPPDAGNAPAAPQTPAVDALGNPVPA